MFDVNDMAAFAWKDFDRNYAISGHSDITGTWVATKDTSQPPDWASRTANRLLTSATVAVETRLFHRTCANSSDGLLCGHVCGGSPLSQATRHVFCIAVGEVRRNEGHMVSMLLTTQHPKTPEGHEVGMQHFDNYSKIFQAMFNATWEIHTRNNNDDRIEHYELKRQMKHACACVLWAIEREASEAGAPVQSGTTAMEDGDM